MGRGRGESEGGEAGQASGLRLKMVHCHFCRILLAKKKSQNQLRFRGKEINYLLLGVSGRLYCSCMLTEKDGELWLLFAFYHNSLDHYTYCSLLYKYYLLESQYGL